MAGAGLPATSTSVDELLSLRGEALLRLRTSRRRVRRPKSGLSASAMLGRGLDFAEVRAYQPGDDVRNMDWNVTARTGIAHTKLFVEERELPCFLMVDMRSSMWFATRGMYKSMLAARLAALLGWCAVANNDRVGGIVFSDTTHTEIRPRSGRNGMMHLIRELARASAGERSADVATDSAQHRVSESNPASQGQVTQSARSDSGSLDQNFARLGRLARAGGEIFVISDFAGLLAGKSGKGGNAAGNDVSSLANDRLKALAHNGQLNLLHIVDPIEEALPEPGRYMVKSRGLRKLLDTNSTATRTAHRDRFEQRVETLRRTAGAGNVHTVSTREHPVVALEKILGGKSAMASGPVANIPGNELSGGLPS